MCSFLSGFVHGNVFYIVAFLFELEGGVFSTHTHRHLTCFVCGWFFLWGVGSFFLREKGD